MCKKENARGEEITPLKTPTECICQQYVQTAYYICHCSVIPECKLVF